MITSIRNERVQAVRRLHRRSARVAERRFVVEGPQAVREALAADGLLELYTVDLADPLARQAAAHGIEVVEVDAKVLQALGETVTPQGLIGIAPLLSATLPSRPKLLAVLHEVNDPGNAGTVIRTADAAGADGVALTGDAVDPHNGKCVRATAGSLWHLPVVSAPDAAALLSGLEGVQVLATSGTGEVDLDDLADSGELERPTAWLFGTEAHGLPEELLEVADVRVRIPLHGRAESLNLATAAAICLYSSARAHRVRERAS